MRERFILIVACFLFFIKVGGQQTFLTYKISGQAYYTRNRVEIPLKIGTLLTIADVIKLTGNSSVSLICNNYASLSCSSGNSPGAFPLKKFKDSCNVREGSITSSFLKFMWKQLLHEEEQDAESVGAVMGAPVRGLNKKYVLRNIPDSINIFLEPVYVDLKQKNKLANKEIILFENTDGGPGIYSEKLVPDSILLNRLAEKIISGKKKCFSWSMKVSDTILAGPKKCACFWDKEEYERLVKSFSMAAINEPDSAYKNLSLGYYLENKMFFAEAYDHYKKALSVYPGEPLFKENISRFLNKYSGLIFSPGNP